MDTKLQENRLNADGWKQKGRQKNGREQKTKWRRITSL